MAKEKESTVASVPPITTSAGQEKVSPPQTIVSGENGGVTNNGPVRWRPTYPGIDYVGC